MAKDRIRLDELDQSKSLDQDQIQEAPQEVPTGASQCAACSQREQEVAHRCLEGPDAAGKGGAIKRVTERLDPRLVRVYSIVKPTPEEYQHHYMWRFWKKLPPHGEITIFDRSWYGRVLVERVEKFCTEAEWKRAYREINEFERQLADDGVILIKFLPSHQR